jgi:hypothetical protein
MSGNLAFEGAATGIARQRINNAAAAGDTVVVAAAAGLVVRAFGLRLSVAGATVVQVKDGAGTVLEVFNFAGAGDSAVLDLRSVPFYLLTAGNAFIINSSAAVQVDGMVEYAQTKPNTGV